MNEILQMYLACGLLGAIVLSGRQGVDANLPTKARQIEKIKTDEALTVEDLKQILEAFNRHDLDAIMEYFSDDCSLDFPRGSEPCGQRFIGKDQVREALAGRLKGIPDVHYGDDRHWVAANMGVSEWTLTGTTTSGVRLNVQGCDHWEFRNGKVVRKDSYWKIVER